MRNPIYNATKLAFAASLLMALLFGSVPDASAQSSTGVVDYSSPYPSGAETQVQSRIRFEPAPYQAAPRPPVQSENRAEFLKPVVDQRSFSTPAATFRGPLDRPQRSTESIHANTQAVSNNTAIERPQVERVAYQEYSVPTNGQGFRQTNAPPAPVARGYSNAAYSNTNQNFSITESAPFVYIQQGSPSDLAIPAEEIEAIAPLPETYASGFPRRNFFGISEDDYCDEWADFCECNSGCDDCGGCSCGSRAAHCLRKLFRCCHGCHGNACRSCKLQRTSSCDSECTTCEASVIEVEPVDRVGVRMSKFKNIFK